MDLIRWKTHLLSILSILIISGGVLPALGAEGKVGEQKPERWVTMGVEYSGIVVPKGEEVSMDLILHNKGRTDETVIVKITEKPKGWKARIKTYRFLVTGVHLPADDKKTLTFEAVPDKGVAPGEYRFKVEAKTHDSKFQMNQEVLISVKGEDEKEKEERGVKLTTSYPVIRGPSDARFEFSLEVDSKLEKEAVFDLLAQGPNGWDINFKPAYESKYISSLRIKGNQSQTIAVEVKPAVNSQAGEYPILIRVSSGDAKGEAKLTVALTGTYALEVGTVSGLLSLEARQGKPSNLSFYIKNTGSAVNTGIKFMSFKPENWKVEFKPEIIENIEPGGLKQVEMTITPYEEALVGDYSVSVNVEGEKANKAIEFRTTVKASSAWGWVGVGIIIAVIGGLFGLFRAMGRR
ncbi:MAG: NEW3 domain-containing protein [Thermodesulfobacteriota bacterium]